MPSNSLSFEALLGIIVGAFVLSAIFVVVVYHSVFFQKKAAKVYSLPPVVAEPVVQHSAEIIV